MVLIPENEPTVYTSTTADENDKGHPRSTSLTPEAEIPGTMTIEKLDEHVVDDSSKYLTGFKLFSLTVSVTLVSFLMLLDMSIIVTAIPRITTQFHSLRDIGWYGSAYNLASAALQPLSGKLYTYFKSKWTYLAFLFLFELGSLICGVATSSKMLIVGRAVAGIGTSGSQNGAFTMIAASVPLEKRPALFGMIMGGSQLGLVIGPLLGGALTQYTTWRWCFYINLPIGGLAALLTLLVHIPDSRIRSNDSVIKIITSKFDFVGFFIFAPCTIMFLLALQYGGADYPWRSATVIGLFCGGGATLVVFLIWEHHVGEKAMIPLPVVRQREVWSACLTMLFLFTSIFVSSYYLPIYFQSVKDASPFTSGVNMLPGIISQLAFAIFAGLLTQKVGYYLPFAVFSGAVLAVGTGLLSTLNPHTSTAKWVGYQILAGFARGVGMQMPIIAIQANTPPQTTPVATAILVSSQTFGGAVFITVSNVIFNNKLKEELTLRLPGVDADAVINAGATAVRDIVSAHDYPQAVAAYAKSVDAAFYLPVAAAVMMFVSAWGMGWKDIRKKKPRARNEA